MNMTMAQFIYEYAGIVLQIASALLFGMVTIIAFVIVLIHAFNVYRMEKGVSS
jgi:hypothetical protein